MQPNSHHNLASVAAHTYTHTQYMHGHDCLSFVGWHHSCVPSWRVTNVHLLPLLAAVLRSLLIIERAWSRDHATSSVIAVLPLPGQCCGTVCLNVFGNRTSPSDNSNDRWKRLCLVSWAAVPCVW